MDSVVKYLLLATGVVAIFVATWEARKEPHSMPSQISIQHHTVLRRISAIATIGAIIFGIGAIGVGIGYPASSVLPPLTEVEQKTSMAVGVACFVVGVICTITNVTLSQWFLRKIQHDEGAYSVRTS